MAKPKKIGLDRRPSGAAVAKKSPHWKVTAMRWMLIVGLPVGFIALLISLVAVALAATRPDPVPPPAQVAKFQGIATQAVNEWVAGGIESFPIASKTDCKSLVEMNATPPRWDSYQAIPITRVVDTQTEGVPAATNLQETHNFTTLVDGREMMVSVTVSSSGVGGAQFITSCPSMIPLKTQFDQDWEHPYWTGWVPDESIDPGIQQQAAQWSKAYFSGDADLLRRLTGDELGRLYPTLGGYSVLSSEVAFSATSVDGTQKLVRVEVEAYQIAAVGPTPATTTEPPETTSPPKQTTTTTTEPPETTSPPKETTTASSLVVPSTVVDEVTFGDSVVVRPLSVTKDARRDVVSADDELDPEDQARTFSFDLLATELGQAYPHIVSWGPPGSGPTLVPYETAYLVDQEVYGSTEKAPPATRDEE